MPTKDRNAQNIARASGVVFLSSIAVGLVSFLKDMIVGLSFGASASMDALLLAYSIPYFIGTVSFAVIQATLIPIYSQIKTDGDFQQLRSFINKMFTLTAFVLIGVTLILFLLAPQLIKLIANSKFNEEQIYLSLTIVRLLLPIIPLMGLFGLFGAVFYAEKKFFLPLLLTSASPVIIVICVWLGKGQWEILSMGTGITLGWLLQVLFITYFFSKYYFQPEFNLALNEFRIHQFISLAWPLLLGSLFSGTTVIIDRVMAVGLPTGSISALDYADRINVLAIGAFSALQTAVFPFFADQVSQSNYKQLMLDFKQTILLLCFVLAPIILVAIIFSNTLVALLFQRGAFNVAATKLTSRAVIGYMIGLLPMMVGMIGVRLSQALKLNKFIGFVGMFNPFTKTILNLLFIPLYGLMGISLATSGMYIVTAIIVFVGVFRFLRVMPTLSDLMPYIKIAISLLGLSAIVLLLNRKEVVASLTFGPEVGYMFLVIFIGFVIYWTGCFLLGLEEARIVPKVIWKMFCKTPKSIG